MTLTTTRNGDRLYVKGSLAFLARHFYCDAWGMTKVAGSLFDLDGGTIQRNAVAWCNVPTTESDIVANALERAGA